MVDDSMVEQIVCSSLNAYTHTRPETHRNRRMDHRRSAGANERLVSQTFALLLGQVLSRPGQRRPTLFEAEHMPRRCAGPGYWPKIDKPDQKLPKSAKFFELHRLNFCGQADYFRLNYYQQQRARPRPPPGISNYLPIRQMSIAPGGCR